MADQVRRAAPEDDPQGRDQHHQVPEGLPRPRHRVPAAAGAARRGQRHRHARVDRQPRRDEQVHAHAPGRVRDEVLLPQRDQQFLRRERLVGHHQAAHPEDHRGGGRPQAAERLEDRQHAAEGGARPGSADHREVPRGTEDSHLQPAQDALLRPSCDSH